MTEVVFTPAQRAAIEVAGAPRDTCVVAGPGSGKTTVLVEYFRRLVEAGALVEPTGVMSTQTGGRPAALFRFRREVLQERPAPGLRVRGRR